MCEVGQRREVDGTARNGHGTPVPPDLLGLKGTVIGHLGAKYALVSLETPKDGWETVLMPDRPLSTRAAGAAVPVVVKPSGEVTRLTREDYVHSVRTRPSPKRRKPTP